jgi:hypothetical protein
MEEQNKIQKCEYCHKNKSVKYIELSSIDGSKRKINLCEKCLLERNTQAFFYAFHRAD